MASPDAPLMPLLLEYLAVSVIDTDAADARSGALEHKLEIGKVNSPDDLFAKARYLQACGRIDPGLIPMEALDTLVNGVARLFDGLLTSVDVAGQRAV